MLFKLLAGSKDQFLLNFILTGFHLLIGIQSRLADQLTYLVNIFYEPVDTFHLPQNANRDLSQLTFSGSKGFHQLLRIGKVLIGGQWFFAFFHQGGGAGLEKIQITADR